jgi:hypothetical protein
VGCVLEFCMISQCFHTSYGEWVVCTNGCVRMVLLVLRLRVFSTVMCIVLLSADVLWNLVLLYDWRFTSQSVRLGVKTLEIHDQRFFFNWNLAIIVLNVISSLMRGCVCRLQLLLSLVSAVIPRSEFHRTHDQMLLSGIPDSPQPGGPGPRI